MWSKNSLLFVFVKPKCTVSIIHMHYKCHFFSLITNVVVTSSFWLCSKFCADKIATSYVFWRCYMDLPTLQICHQSNHYIPDLPALDLCKSAQACCWMPIGCPKKCLNTQIFFQHCESLLFSAVCFLKICQIRPLMKLTKYVCDFFSFCFSYQMTTNSRHIKTGNLPTCSQES